MKRVTLLLLITLLAANALGQKLNKSSRTATATGWNYVDINSVSATISHDGVFGDYRRTNTAGLEWPRGSGKTPVYTSGVWVIGKHKPTDSLRGSVMFYQSEFQPGKIVSTFNTTTNSGSASDDPSKPEYRLYKVVRGLANDDYQNWPVNLGAPFNDVNNNGTWDAGIDSPVKWGDQQLWSVSNDASTSKHSIVSQSKPMGIELQSTFFAYDISGAAGNTVFVRYKIINKSDADYDSVYISYWSDIDLGEANDDQAGVDSLRNLFYAYNGDDNDGTAQGYGTTPPATGFVFLQGPLVYTGSTADTALFEGKKKIGYMNLAPSSHVVILGSNTFLSPGPAFGKDFLFQAKNTQLGLRSNGTSFINPETGQPSKFMFPGDPVTNTGWTHSKSTDRGDNNSLLSAGPFTLAKNDTQEIVVAHTIAQGADRLASITLLRSYVDEIWNMYRLNFTSPSLTQQHPNFYFDFPSAIHSFTTVSVGLLSDTLIIHMGNFGKDTLILNFSTFSNSSFVKVSPAGNLVKIGEGKSVPLKLLFQPQSIGEVNDSIVITSNDSTSLRTVLTLYGIGAQVNAVATGSLYATNGTKLHTVSSSNGAATFVTDQGMGTSYGGIAVRPTTKELLQLGTNGLTRLSANTSSYIHYPYSFSGYKINGSIAFIGDSTLIFPGDSIIGRVNINTGKIDTLHRFLQTYRIQNLAYNNSTNEIYFSIVTMFGLNPDTSDAIFKINAWTKQMTRLGRTKLGKSIRALLFDKNGTLYALVDSLAATPTYLITVNTTTGTGTMIGSTGMSGLYGLAMDPSSPAGIGKQNPEIPQSYSLSQNYPNPFNPSTVISYALPRLSFVTLELFDIIGRKVSTLVQQEQEAGRYDVRLDISSLNLSSGIYLYKLQSGEFTAVKKMCVVK